MQARRAILSLRLHSAEVHAMETPSPAQPNDSAAAPSAARNGIFPDALRFWEPRRILYNLALTAVAAFCVVSTWPHFRPAFTLWSLARLAVLALLANVCYSAAYLVDLPMQASDLREAWKRRRWILLLGGTLFAMFIEFYWIGDEIYPYVN
jgi:hypothetical protein